MGASTDTALPRLHVLVSERELPSAGFDEQATRLFERAGPIALHLRARVTARRAFEAARRLTELADEHGGWCVVNGRPDIALAAGAHAVQLGRAALRVDDARAVVAASGRRWVMGASVHSPDEAASAVASGADYLVSGTIYPTPSHPGRAGSGPSLIRAMLERLGPDRRAPILAIGGIDAGRVAEVVAAGAHGIVVGRAVWATGDPVEAATELAAAVEAALAESRE